MLFVWLRVVVALGLVQFFIAHTFIQNVVFDTMNRLKENFKVAHELLLVYFQAIERDASGKLNLANVYQRGSGDTYLAEARVNADTFFRTGGGTPPTPDDGDSKDVKDWNGKWARDAKAPCVAFNFKQKHDPKNLDATGCCRFNHICMQWVSDKGPRGICGGNHAKVDCTYQADKKLTHPATA